jgi:hypothetical protein
MTEQTTPLDGEISQLRSDLAQDPRYTRLKQLERLRDAYLALPTAGAAPHPQPPTPTAQHNNGHAAEPRPTGGRRRSPEREAAIRETRGLLAGKTEPTRISLIDAHLEEKGIRLNGNDPLNNLSALLSTSGQFVSHGRAGWTLSQ